MISDEPLDLLTIIKSHIPDQKRPISLARQDYLAFYDDIQDDRGDYMITERVELSKGVYGYWITVPESESGNTILFFHGGDFTVGSTKDHLGLCIKIARAARAQVFSVDYRLAPEYVFPAAIEDAIGCVPLPDQSRSSATQGYSGRYICGRYSCDRPSDISQGPGITAASSGCLHVTARGYAFFRGVCEKKPG